MDNSIALTIGILLVSAILFITEVIRIDLVALVVLGTLTLTGLVTPVEALSGFSNPAVVTVWAVFILSGGLSRTGIADFIGRQVLRLAGASEARLLVMIMLTAGLLSAVMNNVGVAALLLPVVMDIARRTGRPPSKLLMPLAYGSLLGGLSTLIGTPPNILASNALQDFNLRPFRMFDFTPLGIAILLSGILFMVLVGRKLLPVRDISRMYSKDERLEPGQVYEMRERMYVLKIPANSALEGKTIEESRLGVILSLNVLSVIRSKQTYLSPEPDFLLHAGDQLVVAGRLDALNELQEHKPIQLENEALTAEYLISADIQIATLELAASSELLGKTLKEDNFRARFSANVLAIWRSGRLIVEEIQDRDLHEGDMLIVQVAGEQLDGLKRRGEFRVSSRLTGELSHLHGRLFAIGIPQESLLVGKSLIESRLGEAYGLNVLGINRNGERMLIPEPIEEIQAGDTLLVEGEQREVMVLQALQELEVDRDTKVDVDVLQSERFGLLEAVLSPHTTLAGKNLKDIHFREKYGLNVLSIWRGGKPYRFKLRDMALRFGDALLLYGPREKLRLLASESDFLLLAQDVQEPLLLKKGPVTALIMVAVVLSVVVGWLPISIAAVVGATLMVLYGSLTMEQAYRYIDWRAVFLIAGMLPLGIALETSGAAQLIAEGMFGIIGGLGPYVLLTGLFLLTSVASQFMPNAVVTVLMAPVALNTAIDQGYSPYALMMVTAIAASAAFLSPVGHPANVLIMGPGGYRFRDYIKVGLPLTIVVLVVTLMLLPVLWPLSQ